MDVIEEAKAKKAAEMKEFDFPLAEKFEYASGGDTAKAEFINLKAPSQKQLVQCTDLKQAFIRATTEQAKANPDAQEKAGESGESDRSIKGEEIVYLLYMSESVDMSKVLLGAIELFTSGVALVDGEARLTKPLIREMSNDDLERMLGEYMVNFILLSVLKGVK